jgi:hypothetical protein
MSIARGCGLTGSYPHQNLTSYVICKPRRESSQAPALTRLTVPAQDHKYLRGTASPAFSPNTHAKPRAWGDGRCAKRPTAADDPGRPARTWKRASPSRWTDPLPQCQLDQYPLSRGLDHRSLSRSHRTAAMMAARHARDGLSGHRRHSRRRYIRSGGRASVAPAIASRSGRRFGAPGRDSLRATGQPAPWPVVLGIARE